MFHTVKASLYKFTYPQCERGSKSSVYNFTAYPLKKVCSTPYPGSSSYMLDSTIQLLHLYPEDTFLGNLHNCITHWLEIYSVNDLIHHLNKWGPVIPPSTLYKVQTRKKFWMHVSNIVCGVRGGVGHAWIWKCPRNAKVSNEYFPWL